MAYPDVVVAAGRGQTALAMGLEVGRVDGGILVVPGHQQRSGLHGAGEGGAAAHQAAIATGTVAEGGGKLGSRGRRSCCCWGCLETVEPREVEDEDEEAETAAAGC